MVKFLTGYALIVFALGLSHLPLKESTENVKISQHESRRVTQNGGFTKLLIYLYYKYVKINLHVNLTTEF
jgi:hypothetical protein